jgi:hypothetical protein
MQRRIDPSIPNALQKAQVFQSIALASVLKN